MSVSTMPQWVLDAIKTGDVLTVTPAADRDIPVCSSTQGASAISASDLIKAYNEKHGTDWKYDVSGEDEVF